MFPFSHNVLLIHYTKFVNEDIEYINSNETHITDKVIIDLYKNKKIRWFTLFFYLNHKYGSVLGSEELKKSRINKKILEKIERLKLYVNFNENKVNNIKELFVQRIKI